MAKNVYDFDIAVLGGGSAGLTVTAGAAQLGAKTLLIEKEDKLGMFAEKLYSDKVKAGLKFFFSLRGRACGVEE